MVDQIIESKSCFHLRNTFEDMISFSCKLNFRDLSVPCFEGKILNKNCHFFNFLFREISINIVHVRKLFLFLINFRLLITIKLLKGLLLNPLIWQVFYVSDKIIKIILENFRINKVVFVSFLHDLNYFIIILAIFSFEEGFLENCELFICDVENIRVFQLLNKFLNFFVVSLNLQLIIIIWSKLNKILSFQNQVFRVFNAVLYFNFWNWNYPKFNRLFRSFS